MVSRWLEYTHSNSARENPRYLEAELAFDRVNEPLKRYHFSTQLPSTNRITPSHHTHDVVAHPTNNSTQPRIQFIVDTF